MRLFHTIVLDIRMKYIIHYLFFIMSIMLFVACSTPVKIIVSNYENSNLNNRHDNVPVTILIYQLKDGKRFEYASPQDLLSRESVVLGKDKIDSMRVQILPNEKNRIAAEINKKEGKYIGILALFANPQHKNQKFYKKLNRVYRNTIKIDITQNGIMQSSKRNYKQAQSTQAIKEEDNE